MHIVTNAGLRGSNEDCETLADGDAISPPLDAIDPSSPSDGGQPTRGHSLYNWNVANQSAIDLRLLYLVSCTW